MIFAKPCTSPHSIINEYFHESLGTTFFPSKRISMFFFRHLLSENMMCCLKFFMKFNTEGGHEKLELKDEGSLKTLVTKWRSYGKFHFRDKYLLAPYPALIMTDPNNISNTVRLLFNYPPCSKVLSTVQP